MSNVKKGDIFVVSRNGTAFQVKNENTGNLRDDDLFWVQRNGVNYSVTADQVNTGIGIGPPELSLVTLSKTTTGDRYTDQLFLTAPTYTTPGNPPPTIGLKAEVTGALSIVGATDEITNITPPSVPSLVNIDVTVDPPVDITGTLVTTNSTAIFATAPSNPFGITQCYQFDGDGAKFNTFTGDFVFPNEYTIDYYLYDSGLTKSGRPIDINGSKPLDDNGFNPRGIRLRSADQISSDYPYSISQNTWNHVRITPTGIWVNGVLRHASVRSLSGYAATSLNQGRYSDSPDYPWVGFLGPVRIATVDLGAPPVGGLVLVGGMFPAPFTTLTLASDANLANGVFKAGDVVKQDNSPIAPTSSAITNVDATSWVPTLNEVNAGQKNAVGGVYGKFIDILPANADVGFDNKYPCNVFDGSNTTYMYWTGDQYPSNGNVMSATLDLTSVGTINSVDVFCSALGLTAYSYQFLGSTKNPLGTPANLSSGGSSGGNLSLVVPAGAQYLKISTTPGERKRLYLYSITVNGELLGNSETTLTLTDASGLSGFNVGDVVQVDGEVIYSANPGGTNAGIEDPNDQYYRANAFDGSTTTTGYFSLATPTTPITFTDKVEVLPSGNITSAGINVGLAGEAIVSNPGTWDNVWSTVASGGGTIYNFSCDPPLSASYIYAWRVDGVIVTFTGEGQYTSITAITPATPSITTDGGTWNTGEVVTGPATNTTATFVSADPLVPSMTLSNVVGPWSANTGNYVENTVVNPVLIKPETSAITNVSPDGTTLTFTDDKDLAQFAPGDAVYAGGGAGPTGVVGDITGLDMTLSASTGTWEVGQTVTMDEKPALATTASLVFDANGQVSDVVSNADFVNMNSSAPIINFPSTLGDGSTPDQTLPDGTSIKTTVRAWNELGESVKSSNTVTPTSTTKLSMGETRVVDGYTPVVTAHARAVVKEAEKIRKDINRATDQFNLVTAKI